MVATTWQGSEFHLHRIVLAERLPAHYAEELQTLAETLGLAVSSDATRPLPGDLWIASYPDPTSPGRPEDVRWVSALELPVALNWLRHLAGSTRRPVERYEVTEPLLVG